MVLVGGVSLPAAAGWRTELRRSVNSAKIIPRPGPRAQIRDGWFFTSEISINFELKGIFMRVSGMICGYSSILLLLPVSQKSAGFSHGNLGKI